MGCETPFRVSVVTNVKRRENFSAPELELRNVDAGGDARVAAYLNGGDEKHGLGNRETDFGAVRARARTPAALLAQFFHVPEALSPYKHQEGEGAVVGDMNEQSRRH